ncbi:chymotrypsin inhibitor-like [Osmia bicornis bicornis]|uniref:chymotrypsin inhibitor-like n=1 Tax=Osmia bicornis bicornis TaxID=1437191 RepID=UPI0010F66FB1|nr:chymotrypsin inhibitor-like [Osmia bicornis bicornis]
MSRFIFALFAILVIFSASQSSADAKCPENEVWNSCGSACPRTCEQPNPICTLQCVRRCQCKGDLVRNNDGKCIPLKEC